MGARVWTLPEDGQPATWIEPEAGALPPGGTTGEVLTKESDADGDAGWEPGGGSMPALPLDLGPGIYQISTTGVITWLPTDVDNPLFSFQAPVGFFNGDSGMLFDLKTEDGIDYFSLDVYGDLTLNTDDGAFAVKSRSNPGYVHASAAGNIESVGADGFQRFYVEPDSHTTWVWGNFKYSVTTTGPGAWGGFLGYEFFSSGLSEPADEDVAAGTRLQWYDSASGAPVLRLKEADDDGAISTGIALSSSGSQDTVGAAGGASALPATPSHYMKVRDVNGAAWVFPVYAAA